ncbi:serine/threonine-protein kinase [soil metagenome]
MSERSERSDDLNVLPPTDASATMPGIPRESAMLAATPVNQYQTTPQGQDSAAESSGKSCQVIVSGYELLEEIGRGGMGVVFRARNLGLMRDVAVKLLQDRFPINGTAAERFLEEARITGQLQHPGIPPVHQVGRLDGGRPYLAMKLIKGRSLAELLDKKADINILGIFEQIAQTLGYAHANGVIHRDLKPANVMVGAFGEVQVMDWGLAKVLDQPDRDSADYDVKTVRLDTGSESDLETKAGSFLGTPAFMPPEQARGEFDKVGPHSDVFGLGAILCMMLTGRPPFKGFDANSTRMLAAEGKLEEAYARFDKCEADPELIALCKKCLAFNAEERYANGAEVATAIAKMRAESDDRARQAEVDKAKSEVQAAEERKRDRVKKRLGAAVLAAVIFGGGIAIWQMLVAFDARNKAQQAFEAKDEETRRLNKARKQTFTALNEMSDNVVGKLFVRRPQLDDSEKNFLKKVIDLYEQATEELSDSEDAQNQRAEGRLRVGILWQKFNAYDEAEKALTESLAIRQKLSDALPANPEFRLKIAETQRHLGKIYQDTARLDAAEKAFSYARDLMENLTLDYPEKTDYRNAFAECRSNLALLYRTMDQGDLFKRKIDKTALEESELIAARDIRRKLVADVPNNPKYLSDLAISTDNLGTFYNFLNRFPAAEREYNDARKLLDDLIKQQDEKKQVVDAYQHSLAKVHNNLGNLYQVRSRIADAEREYRAALAVMTKLVREFPGTPDYRNDLAYCHNNLGNLFRAAENYTAAETEFQAAIDIQTKLVADYPTVPQYCNAMANTFVGMAGVKRKTNAIDEAKKNLAAAKPYHAIALEKDGKNNPQYIRAMIFHQWETADVALAEKDDAAMPAIVQALVALGPENAELHLLAAGFLARSHHADLAMAEVQTAVKKGFKDAKYLQTQPNLESLRSRDDFQKLIGSLK